MWRFGFTLDNLSLMALTLSIGFLVDDAIVMLENIIRHGEMGKQPMQAALDGSREIGFTIISMTISLVAVFIPILFLGGVVGRLFHEFAITIGAAILISGVISLTLTPMLSSRFLRPSVAGRRSRLFRASERAFERGRGAYDKGLLWSLNHGRLVLVFSVATLLLTFLLFRMIPAGFFPSEDTGRLTGITQAQEGISFESMSRHQLAAMAVVKNDPNVESFMSNVGGFLASNQGILFIRLVPRSKRPLSADRVIEELRPKLGQIPGLRVFLQNPPPISMGTGISQSQYQYTLQGTNTDQLFRAAQQLTERMQKLGEVQDVASDLLIRNPQINVAIDRDKAAVHGISAQTIETALAAAFSSSRISTIYTSTNEYWVILELLPHYQEGPADVSALYLHSSNGNLVPLSTVTRIVQGLGPASINHLGQLPSVTISFNLARGVALGTAVAAVTALGRQTLPAGITTSFQGSAQAFQSSLRGLGTLLIMAIVVIYLVLGILYESFIHPFTILSALPFAGFGALMTLLVFKVELSIYAFVGIILLIGLVKKNGIMMIDFALQAQQREGKSPRDAIREACLIRFRPIMMTTFAALLATLPIAIGFGAGSESRRPLGLAVVGGLLFSQFLTLFVTPVFYLYMDGLQSWIGRMLRRRKEG
jgi:HAE1 family hydrophobic/amphiphilic exporter-1